MHEMHPAITPTRRKTFACSTDLFSSRYSAPTAHTTNDPVMTAPDMLCAYSSHAQGFMKNCQKLVNSKVPSGTTGYATGCCIQALVTMMKNPEIQEPSHTITAEPQCPKADKRFSPKRNRPRNADSRKNAKTPSIASGWPITPPVTRENCDSWCRTGIPLGFRLPRRS